LWVRWQRGLVEGNGGHRGLYLLGNFNRRLVFISRKCHSFSESLQRCPIGNAKLIGRRQCIFPSPYVFAMAVERTFDKDDAGGRTASLSGVLVPAAWKYRGPEAMGSAPPGQFFLPQNCRMIRTASSLQVMPAVERPTEGTDDCLLAVQRGDSIRLEREDGRKSGAGSCTCWLGGEVHGPVVTYAVYI
jgi:hypothetical protein